MDRPIILAHLINPVAVSPTSDLFRAQPITFKTLATARRLEGKFAETKLFACCFQEDEALIPGNFVKLPFLQRAVTDLDTFHRPRKLPILADLLNQLDQFFSPTSRRRKVFYIYSNVDIAVQPYFYRWISEKINEGVDAMIINRRTISADHTDLKAMYADAGAPHPGYDCFVFSRELYSKFFLADACIGANWIGRVLALNLVCLAKNFKLYENEKLTFHLGDDRSWQATELNDYEVFNRKQMAKVVAYFEKKNLIKDNPLAERIQKALYQAEGLKWPPPDSLITRIKRLLSRF